MPRARARARSRIREQHNGGKGWVPQHPELPPIIMRTHKSAFGEKCSPRPEWWPGDLALNNINKASMIYCLIGWLVII